VGDPLMVVNFPVDTPNEQDPFNTLITNNEGIRLLKESLEESLAYALRQARLAEELLETVYLSENLEEEVSLLYVVNQWKNFRNESDQYNLLTSPVMNLIRYIRLTTRSGFAEWLTNNNEKTTEFMRNLIQSGIPIDTIADTLIHNEGSWQYDFTYLHPRQKLENIFFELQIATDSDFTNVVVDESSLVNVSGWRYEQEINIFVQIISEGFPSSFSGRRVRYVAPPNNYLVRTEIYFVRWRSIDGLGGPIGDWNVDSNEMIIKR
jgi:hypothetical protein